MEPTTTAVQPVYSVFDIMYAWPKWQRSSIPADTQRNNVIDILRKRHSLIDGHLVWVCDICNDIDFAVLVVLYLYIGTSH